MRRAVGILATGFWAAVGVMWAQDRPQPPWAPVQLDISAEVATTTAEGYPSSLRVTLTNVGSDPVTMPVPGACSPANGFRLVVGWTAKDGRHGFGPGGGCGGPGASLVVSARRDWVLLRSGEYITETLNLRVLYENFGPGTVSYQVVYDPPSATEKDLSDLAAAGLIIPTEQIKTDDEQFAFGGGKALPAGRF